jgi:hypothetical protein
MYMAFLYERIPVANSIDCVLSNKIRLQFYIRLYCRTYYLRASMEYANLPLISFADY